MNFFYAFGALLFLAVLPISETIALRNLVLFLLTLGWVGVVVCQLRQHGWGAARALLELPWFWWVWVVYLLLFPLWAPEPVEAWLNLAGHWGESLLAWCAGFALFFISKNKRPGLFATAVATSGPVWVHLCLVLAVWFGLLGTSLAARGDVPWSQLARFVTSWDAWPGFQAFPWGFRGVEPMHGNIGYPACVGIALFGAYGLSANILNTHHKYLTVTLGLVGCFASVLIANSRGAFLYGLFVLTIVGLLAWFLQEKKSVVVRRIQSAPGNKPVFAAALGLVAVGVSLFMVRQSVERDTRWALMVDRVQVGFMAQDPLDVLCHDVPQELEHKIRHRFSAKGQTYVDDLLAGLRTQDGGRILLMRAGLLLALEHPLGLDGSRLSYQKVIEQRCGAVPALHFSHAHQGWLDTALAIGWAGACVLFLLYAHLAVIGWRALRFRDARPWAVGLMSVAVFWILRGFADSVYREHFLQMQAFVLAYLYMNVRAKISGQKTQLS